MNRRHAPLLAIGLIAVACAFAATASASVPGLLYVGPNASAFDSANQKLAPATCPGSELPLGGGATILGGDAAEHQVGLVSYGANAERANGSVLASEDQDGFDQNGFPGDWGVSAIVACARPVSPFTPEAPGLDYKRVITTTDPSSNSVQFMTSRCPAGLKLFGMGERIIPPTSAALGQFGLDGLTRWTDCSWSRRHRPRARRTRPSGSPARPARTFEHSELRRRPQRRVRSGEAEQADAPGTPRCRSGKRL